MSGSIGARRIARDQGRDPLGRVPGVVLMDRLKIVRAKHEDDERERRIDFDALLDSCKTVSSRLERIVPDGATAVQAILDHAHRMRRSEQFGLDNPGHRCENGSRGRCPE